ncbi:MAG: hypothetical protein MUC83_05100, partial [Pirellula sp.]|nr:hypothetical protein [Pirellula sp.]
MLTTRAPRAVSARSREAFGTALILGIAGLVSSLRRFGPAKISVSCHNLAVLRFGSQFPHPSDVPFPIFQDPAMSFAQEKSPFSNIGSIAL